MNTKQKMIEAMAEHRQTCANGGVVVTMGGLLDAALAVLENEKDFDEYSSFIEFIRNQEPKP